MHIPQLVNYFIALLVICSPLSALPALLGLTHGRSMDEKRQIGIKSGIAVGVILIVVTWIGESILEFFGIRLPAFQLAGGFVVLLVALAMLNAEPSRIKQTTEDQKEAKEKDSIAIVPLAIPIMAGPGAISTVIVATNNFPGPLNRLYLTLCGVLVAVVMATILYFAGTIDKMLGNTGINIINRIGGLILAAMAVDSIARGAVGLFPVLGTLLPGQ